MHFIHYKDFVPVNLDKVGTIGKENQQVAKDVLVYSIGFYDFERKVGFWMFQTADERDKVYEGLKKQFSKPVAV